MKRSIKHESKRSRVLTLVNRQNLWLKIMADLSSLMKTEGQFGSTKFRILPRRKAAILAMAKAQGFPTSVGNPAPINDQSMTVDETTCPFVGKKRNCLGNVTG